MCGSIEGRRRRMRIKYKGRVKEVEIKVETRR
jgi:hypothetical protein